MTIDWTFRMGETAIVFATLLGPVLAVQAQKWIERVREKKQRQIGIFGTLMATRAAFLSPAHVEALNAVPIEFYGNKKIVNSWKEYLDNLSKQGVPAEVWAQRRVDLFVDLLVEMAAFVGYNFTRVEISREVYWPTAHARIEADQQIIREGLAKLFRGEAAIPMAVKSFPVEALALEEQQDLRRLLLKWLGGKQSVKVDLNSPLKGAS
jgi:uncharacterized protein DUF6680